MTVFQFLGICAFHQGHFEIKTFMMGNVGASIQVRVGRNGDNFFPFLKLFSMQVMLASESWEFIWARMCRFPKIFSWDKLHQMLQIRLISDSLLLFLTTQNSVSASTWGRKKQESYSLWVCLQVYFEWQSFLNSIRTLNLDCRYQNVRVLPGFRTLPEMQLYLQNLGKIILFLGK